MSKDTEVIRTTVGDFISGDVVIGAYINGEYSITLPQKSDGYIVEKVVCDNNAIGEWNYEEWSLITKNITTKSKCNVYFKDGVLANYDYSDSEEVFTVPISGTYKLEAWGAQGRGGGGSGYIGNSLLIVMNALNQRKKILKLLLQLVNLKLQMKVVVKKEMVTLR